MARKKSIKKAKEPVKIRFKSLANGNQSIYLDIYHHGKRNYEFLKLYLIPEVDEAAKIQNVNTMQAANAIKSKRIIDMANGDAGIVKKGSQDKMLLIDWMHQFKEQKEQAMRRNEREINVEKVIKHLNEYRGENVTMANVDKAYCEGFLIYLSTAKSRRETLAIKNKDKKNITVLSKFTQGLYWNIFKAAIKKAVRDGIMSTNPIDKIDKKSILKVGESHREYLEIPELKSMIETECSNKIVKMAFLFSCYTGLRISDVRRLKWGDLKAVQRQDGNMTYKLSILMKKTRRWIEFTLPVDALKWMPQKDKESDDKLVFSSLRYDLSTINYHLKRWAKQAGVKKNISYHVSRHTFATMILTLGADIYTTSKLLGHTKVATTEIYAKIVDKKKDDAMNLMDGVL